MPNHNFSKNNYRACQGTNWLGSDLGSYWITITRNANNTYNVYGIIGEGQGRIDGTYFYAYKSGSKEDIRPVLYLSSKVQITGGDGSQSNPYTIE